MTCSKVFRDLVPVHFMLTVCTYLVDMVFLLRYDHEGAVENAVSQGLP